MAFCRHSNCYHLKAIVHTATDAATVILKQLFFYTRINFTKVTQYIISLSYEITLSVCNIPQII